jgi:hypothetical protein
MILLVGSCASGDTVPTTTLEPTPSGFTRYTAPPNQIPQVSLGTTPLRLTQSAWRVNGQYRVAVPPSAENVVQTRVAWRPKSARLVFRVDSPVVPSQAAVLIFERVPEGVVPNESEGRILDCVKGPGCSVAANGTDHVEVAVAFDPVLPAVVVLDMQYATLEPADTKEGIATYGASWAARVSEP